MPRFIDTAFLVLSALVLLGAARVQPEDELNGPPSPEAIERLLNDRLPAGWHASTPTEDLGAWQTTLSPPARWHGNPLAAAIKLCPSPDSPVWKAIPRLQVVVRYHGRTWPGYDCSP